MEERMRKEDAEFDATYLEEPLILISRPSKRYETLDLSPDRGGIDVPFSIGRPR
jgi:hypothetical protein